ncbi:MAG TPA: HlyD family type I secretion periplasmic adaptor subunit, partial [Azospirillum sp.]
QLADDWASDRARLAGAEGEVRRLQAARVTLRARIARVAAVLPLLRERVATRAFLVERNLTARSELLKLRQELVESEREAEVLTGQLHQAELDVIQAEERQRQTAAERTGALLRRLGAQEQEAAALAAELRKATERQARRTLLAPADGVVTELAVHTLGGVVREAEALMKIVPEDGLLEIEARVRNRDVGFVRPGQPVEVKVDTFAFTRYGALPGTLLDVAADAAADDPQNATYKARIALERDTLRVDGRDVRLQPGMTVTVDIRTGHRRAIEYVLAPMLRLTGEAMRER